MIEYFAGESGLSYLKAGRIFRLNYYYITRDKKTEVERACDIAPSFFHPEVRVTVHNCRFWHECLVPRRLVTKNRDVTWPEMHPWGSYSQYFYGNDVVSSILPSLFEIFVNTYRKTDHSGWSINIKHWTYIESVWTHRDLERPSGII